MKFPIELKRPLVVFDLETTGLFPRKDRIIEIAAVKMNPDGTEERLEHLVNPEMPIPPETTAIHGVDDAMVKNCPTFAELADEIYAFFEGCDIAGFNSDRYDIPCLESEFLRVGRNFAAAFVNRVDVQRVYHKMEPRDLSTAVKFYCDRPHEGAHGAMADAVATRDVLAAQLARAQTAADGDRYAELKGKDIAAIDSYLVPHDPLNADRAGFFRWRDGVLYVNFGKKKGEPLKRIMLKEPSFLRWIVKGDFDTDVKAIAADALEGRLPPPPSVG